mmetsp:Transcript_1341/g.3044  ORF Transcript_1341/g.3044 Transcript_1341/m.3044 type:complete len:358 (-) Transcript_1341:914-1987(-)
MLGAPPLGGSFAGSDPDFSSFCSGGRDISPAAAELRSRAGPEGPFATSSFLPATSRASPDAARSAPSAAGETAAAPAVFGSAGPAGRPPPPPPSPVELLTVFPPAGVAAGGDAPVKTSIMFTALSSSVLLAGVAPAPCSHVDNVADTCSTARPPTARSSSWSGHQSYAVCEAEDPDPDVAASSSGRSCSSTSSSDGGRLDALRRVVAPRNSAALLLFLFPCSRNDELAKEVLPGAEGGEAAPLLAPAAPLLDVPPPEACSALLFFAGSGSSTATMSVWPPTLVRSSFCPPGRAGLSCSSSVLCPADAADEDSSFPRSSCEPMRVPHTGSRLNALLPRYISLSCAEGATHSDSSSRIT